MALEITKLDSELAVADFDLQTVDRLDDTHVAVAYIDGTQVFTRVFEVDATTGEITALGSELTVGSTTSLSEARTPRIRVIDSSNYIVAYADASVDGFAQLISVDGSWACSLNGSALEFDTAQGQYITLTLMDSTHVLVTWQGNGSDGFAQVLSFNTGTGSISTVGTPLEYDVSLSEFNSALKLSSSKVLLFYNNLAIVLNVNTSTWAVTVQWSSLAFEANDPQGRGLALIEETDTDYVVACLWYDATDNDTLVQTFEVNKSTWVVTAFGAQLGISSGISMVLRDSIEALPNAEGVICFARDLDSGNAYVVNTFSYDNSTGDLTLEDSATVTGGDRISTTTLSSRRFVAVWEGRMQAFDVAAAVTAVNPKVKLGGAFATKVAKYRTPDKMLFDGVNDRINTNVTATDINFAKDFSIGISFKMAADEPDFMLVQGDVVSPYSSAFIFGVQSLDALVWVNGTPIGTLSTYEDGQWHNLVLTYKTSTGLASVYIDGAFVGSATPSVIAPVTNIFVGGNAASPGTAFSEGQISDFFAYERELSSGEVSTINAQGPLGFTTDLLTYQRGYGNTNAAWADVQGNRNGTVEGSPAVVSGSFVEKPLKVKVGGTFQ